MQRVAIIKYAKQQSHSMKREPNHNKRWTQKKNAKDKTPD